MTWELWGPYGLRYELYQKGDLRRMVEVNTGYVLAEWRVDKIFELLLTNS